MTTTRTVKTRSPITVARRLPIGAEPGPDGTHFRVCAPKRERVDVVADPSGDSWPLEREENGYFAGLVEGIRPGARYRYRLDGGDAFPDPASRFQPDGPHGPSEVVDPASYRWTDGAWRGAEIRGQVIYELHVGTFSPTGDWDGAIAQLPDLARLGVTAVEVMPVADFPGTFGWGYDGVNLFAPTRLYGRPDDFRRFVNEAHRLGLAVLLDVVYNHFGPDGNYLRQFSDHYFTDRHVTEWGEAINFDDTDSGPVREFFTANAGYWIDEFHLDGLRLDATQAIRDTSPESILTAIGRRVREAAGGRATIVVAEDESQRTQLVRPAADGGYGLDGLWNDDFHHTALVTLTGRREYYYADYGGTPQELISSLKYGYLFQGQPYKAQGRRRGSPAFGLSPVHFVSYIENHDQVANSARGLRSWQLTSPGRWRAMTALTLLGPGTPMLFMGQEYAASTPFLYFADHNPELAALVRKGRADFLAQFASISVPEVRARLDDPESRTTFERCRLDFSERDRHPEALALHTDLIALRREDPVFRMQEWRGVDGAVLGPEALVLRFFAEDGMDRLVVANFGADLHLYPCPEPLLAPPAAAGWTTIWTSEDPRYGGSGTPRVECDDGWHIPGETAVVLAPDEARDPDLGT